MNYLVAKAQALWATRDEGATAVEYGLMVALIAVVIVVAVTALGSKLSGLFTSVTSSI
jgi:pilus assembly protein Flp/PilA